ACESRKRPKVTPRAAEPDERFVRHRSRSEYTSFCMIRPVTGEPRPILPPPRECPPNGFRSRTFHSTAFFSNMFSTVSTLFTVFGERCTRLASARARGRCDRVEPLRAGLRNQIRREDLTAKLVARSL